MALLAAATVFLTVIMFALSFRRGDSDPVRARVAGLSTSHTFVGDQPMPSFKERVLGPLMAGFSDKATAILPKTTLDWLGLKLARAGDPITPAGFLLICTAGFGVLGGLGLLMIIVSGGVPTPKSLGIA